MSIQEPLAPVAPPSPAESLYSALEELGRAQREAAALMARRLDWPRAGIAVLRMLSVCGPVQLTDVAAKLRVDVSVASRQVGQLVDAGYVRRTVDVDDRRARVLELTDEGHDLAGQLTAQFAVLFGELFAGWTDEDLRDSSDRIRRVAAAISSTRTMSHQEEGTH
jgi:DNA-binding MarR family transcriptional regulator